MENLRTNKKHRAGGFKTTKKINSNQSKAKLDKVKQSKILEFIRIQLQNSGATFFPSKFVAIWSKPRPKFPLVLIHFIFNQINEKYMDIDDSKFLTGILYPISIEEFKQKYYRKKALVIKAGDPTRFNSIVEGQLHNLDLQELCEDSSNENVQIFYNHCDDEEEKNKKIKNKGIENLSTNDVSLATKSYEKGRASLCFSSSAEFRELYCKQIANQIGMNFSAYNGDFSSMSSCEILASKKGLFTNFLIDYHENFSINLRGKNKWKLYKSGITSPLTSFTPHYIGVGDLENQIKLLRMNTDFDYDPDTLNSLVDEIELCPGDILYHPAGIWQAIECLEDSISINFSLKNYNMADLIAQSLKHLMNQDPVLRENITFSSLTDLKSQVDSGVQKAIELMKGLSSKLIIPQNMIIPRYLKFDFSSGDQIYDMKNKFKFKISKNTKLTFNPLSMIIKKTDIPQNELPDSDYVIHHNFAGNPEYESMMRAEITVDPESKIFLDELVHLRAINPSHILKLTNFKVKNQEKLMQITKALIYTGLLTIVDQ